MIVAENVSRRFGRNFALRGVSFELGREKVALLGHNGAGKSTLAKIIAGILKPSSGRVRVLGEDPAKSGEVRRKIGIVTHNPMLYPELTTIENVKFFSKLYGCEVDEDLLKFLGLERRLNERVANLSAGWLRRVSIARALMHKPEVLIIDEVSGLDAGGKKRIFELIKDFEGFLIYVTHEVSEVRDFDRFLVLRDGRLVYDGNSYEDAVETL
ncbi:MAG: ABC transporter ATP-binding protein [Archaeoglobaceae archaeon]